MRLASRVSAFFLAAQAAILVGFSAALYLLAADHLSRQIDERLGSALAMLDAAADVGDHDVSWDLDQNVPVLGRDAGPDQVQWIVLDERNRIVDHTTSFPFPPIPTDSHSTVAPPPPPPPGKPKGPKHHGPKGKPAPAGPTPDPRLGTFWTPPAGTPTARWAGPRGTWRVKLRALAPRGPVAAEAKRDPDEFGGLTLAAYAPLAPMESTLALLAATLAALSAGLWGASAWIGRRLCGRALAPLAEMASAATEADASLPETRLPVAATGDELQELGDAFNGLLSRLHEALERQQRFAGDASHQLRTPLAGLLSQVDVCLRRERPAEEYRRVLGAVRGSAAELRQIVESLLFLARAESEAGRPDLAAVDLSAWAPAHLARWSTHPRAGDLKFESSLAGPLWARVHPPLLSQLVDNLLENAAKYSPPQSQIVFSVAREAGEAVLSVSDQGCGLSPEEQAQVFQPFYRSPRARNRGQSGVGLGLAVAQRIAAAFGGTIRVQSAAGAGSRFEVRIPEADPPILASGGGPAIVPTLLPQEKAVAETANSELPPGE